MTSRPPFQRPSNGRFCPSNGMPSPLPSPLPTGANALPTACSSTPHTPRALEGAVRALRGPSQPPNAEQVERASTTITNHHRAAS